LGALLLERGIVIPQGKRKLEQYLVALMDEQDAQGLSPRMRMLIVDLRAQWQELDRHMASSIESSVPQGRFAGAQDAPTCW
jgi:transposase